ncbi:MAG TPA: acylphosphatase [Thermoplasmata archaeon]|nr:acylphosphatase [Thermoplasmata archaeon]
MISDVRIRAHVFFGGKVQGVFFRANAQKYAESLGLVGWARNTSDGRVEAVFEGEQSQVLKAIDWCEHKQPYAKVTSMEIENSEPTGEFSEFAIVW